MPQMAPLMWLPLLISNLMMLYLIIASVHHSPFLTSMINMNINNSYKYKMNHLLFKKYVNKWKFMF
nr:TPA_asm: ATP synthase F0 subunit 8 [Pseudomyrmex particeps]